MKKMLLLATMVTVLGTNLNAGDPEKNESVKSDAPKVTTEQKKPRFSFKDHNRTVLTGKSIDVLNIVLAEMPMSTIRMFKAAVSAKKVLAKIEEIKTATTAISKDKEAEFIKTCLSTVLDPVRDFFVELKAYKGIIGAIFKQSLGENAEKGILLKSLDQKDNFDIIEFLTKEITSIDDLESAVSEFLIFFTDVETSLRDDARKAYKDTLEKLKNAQNKNKDKTK